MAEKVFTVFVVFLCFLAVLYFIPIAHRAWEKEQIQIRIKNGDFIYKGKHRFVKEWSYSDGFVVRELKKKL